MKKIYPTPPYRFCPFCKGDLSKTDPFRQVCARCGFVLYHNSSPCVGAVPVDTENRVLLAQRGVNPFKGGWNIIGGFLNYGEDPMDGLKREVKEETGADCEILDLIGMLADTYGDNGPALINISFTVRLLTDKIAPCDDIVDLKWFDLDRLPDNLPFASDRNILKKLKEKLK